MGPIRCWTCERAATRWAALDTDEVRATCDAHQGALGRGGGQVLTDYDREMWGYQLIVRQDTPEVFAATLAPAGASTSDRCQTTEIVVARGYVAIFGDWCPSPRPGGRNGGVITPSPRPAALGWFTGRMPSGSYLAEKFLEESWSDARLVAWLEDQQAQELREAAEIEREMTARREALTALHEAQGEGEVADMLEGSAELAGYRRDIATALERAGAWRAHLLEARDLAEDTGEELLRWLQSCAGEGLIDSDDYGQGMGYDQRAVEHLAAIQARFAILYWRYQEQRATSAARWAWARSIIETISRLWSGWGVSRAKS